MFSSLFRSAYFSTSFFSAVIAGLQFLSFILLGRFLGPEEYSRILAIAIYSSILVELLGLGCGDYTIKSLSYDKFSLSQLVVRTFWMILLTILPAYFIFYLLFIDSQEINSFNFLAISLYFVMDTVLTRSLAYFEHVHIALNRYNLLNFAKLFTALFKLALVVSVTLFNLTSDVSQWMLVYSVMCSINIIIIWTYLFSNYTEKGDLFDFSLINTNGFTFSIVQIIRGVQFSVDRYIIQNNFSASVFSKYAISFRIVQLSFIPIQSVLKIIYPGYFKAASISKLDCFEYAMDNYKKIFYASVLSCFAIITAAPIIEWMLGVEFTGVKENIFYFCLLPFFVGFNYMVQDFYSAINRNQIRIFFQLLLICLIGAGYALFTFEEISHFILYIYICYLLQGCLSFSLMYIVSHKKRP